MQLFTSNSMLSMEKSMSFLWAKQTATLDNISNAETPGYKTKFVTFEESLNERLHAAQRKAQPGAAIRGAVADAEWTVHETEESTRMDGNGVNVAEQSLEMVRTAYQLQYTMQAISSDLATLRTAITG